MKFPSHPKIGDRFIVWIGGNPTPGIFVKIVELYTDNKGLYSEPPLIIYRGHTYRCAWRFLRRITIYTFFRGCLFRLMTVLFPWIKRYIMGTI